MKYQKLWCGLTLSTALLMSTAGAATYQDTVGHWAQNNIERFSQYGILQGSNGSFRPNAPITRGEMAVILDRLMKYQVKSSNTFSDLPEHFYTDAILKAAAAGVMQGNDGQIRPNDSIRRVEAVVMLARALQLSGSADHLTFADTAQIPEWARESVAGMAPYLSGDAAGNFAPNRNITRAETVTILANLFGEVFATPGTYQMQTDQDVVISSTNVTLKDCVIAGDLYLAPGIAQGDVTLDNVTVKGRTLIWGGGSNSIHVNGGTLGLVMIARPDGTVRLDVKNNATISQVEVYSDAILDGVLTQATLFDGDLTVRGNLQNLQIDANANKPAITVEKDAQVQNLTVTASAQITVSGQVDRVSIQSTAPDTTIQGTGRVKQVQTDANNTRIETQGTRVTAGKNATGVTNHGVAVAPGQTHVDKPTSSSTSNGGSGSSGGSSGGSGGGSTPTPDPLSITAVQSVQNGLVRVVLNRATDAPLPLSAFHIICTGGGKDMTILRVSTIDNRVYDLHTTYYDDNTYNLQITLPDGTRLYHDFVTKFDCADIQILSVKRTSDTSATVEYTTDVNGELFYLLQSRARFARADLGMPTAEELLQNGTKVQMTDQHQILKLSDLTPDISYDVYYVARDTQFGYERVTPVKSFAIPAQPEQETGDITITNLDYDFRIDGFDNTAYWFTATLSKPTSEKLNVDAFTLSCPKGNFALDRVESNDSQTYTVYLKQGTLPYSNISVTMTITLPDDSTTQESVYFDTDAPIINWDTFTWKTPDTAEIQIRSSESGTLYYKIYDSVEQDTSPKDPTDIFETGTPVSITSGLNYLTIDGLTDTSGKYFCFATKDQKNNASLYYTYKLIPSYQEPQPPQEGPKITSVDVQKANHFLGGFVLTIQFDQQVTWRYDATDDITVSNTGSSRPTIETSGNATGDTFEVTFADAILLAGSHRLQMRLIDGTIVTYDFTTTEDIGAK